MTATGQEVAHQAAKDPVPANKNTSYVRENHFKIINTK